MKSVYYQNQKSIYEPSKSYRYLNVRNRKYIVFKKNYSSNNEINSDMYDHNILKGVAIQRAQIDIQVSQLL